MMDRMAALRILTTILLNSVSHPCIIMRRTIMTTQVISPMVNGIIMIRGTIAIHIVAVS